MVSTASTAIDPEFEQVLGVRFINAPVTEAVRYSLRHRGYTVVPAAPALARVDRDPEYARALFEADLAIADSGFMVLLWRVLRRRKLTRVSGLRYLLGLLSLREFGEEERVFFVLPTAAARERMRCWLESQSISRREANSYIAPRYGIRVEDEQLLALLREQRPEQIVIAIGGGTQEKLGWYLRQHLDYKPAIHCIGAALGFLTGDQPPIPLWADKLYLGWLLRFLRQPHLYGPRYLGALRLPALIWRYGEKAPRQSAR
ncbi:MAG: WecB/TagA/CpsF family glycosyltransferase [Verrucomicrobia bacterium]|nr:WecB/TagA/CpsF family glycosyltransferase [Verrucomicrobiota bacterium]